MTEIEQLNSLGVQNYREAKDLARRVATTTDDDVRQALLRAMARYVVSEQRALGASDGVLCLEWLTVDGCDAYSSELSRLQDSEKYKAFCVRTKNLIRMVGDLHTRVLLGGSIRVITTPTAICGIIAQEVKKVTEDFRARENIQIRKADVPPEPPPPSSADGWSKPPGYPPTPVKWV